MSKLDSFTFASGKEYDSFYNMVAISSPWQGVQWVMGMLGQGVISERVTQGRVQSYSHEW